ncbi:Acyl-CoA dehydrogenase [Novosphingobium sp. CF614]|uniref:acyl-CoA dehydrogenase family protein n=1 Tax=Novosphingobium sp. CF614 TaxID=1884364 RepID=UPI0008F4343E|nr:acyl-CoA dehydrogenase family protein [Novosphingobium sp. CF614]SFF77593.1 Acyl-CoA dehydrogenase [Novosphingobium sp. CF614]
MSAGSEMVLDEAELATLRESIADVLTSECDSRAVHAWLDRENDLGSSLWRQATDLGWLGLSLPEADGGLGLGARGLQLLNAELGAHAAPGGFIPTLCVAQWLSHVSGFDQREALLGAVVSGEAAFAVPALLEEAKPLAQSADGGTVSGSLEVLGGVPEAAGTTYVVVPVASGWAIVHVDGVAARLDPIEAWDLTRNLSRLECSNAPVVALIPDGDGKAGALLGSYVALALAADSVGAAKGIALRTIEYMKERFQFDRPIASFQALRHRAADLFIKIATQESLLEQAVQCLDNGSPDADMWARLAKAGASEAFVFVAADCIQLHGGVGHTWEYDPHIYIKRARLNEALLGSNRALREAAMGLLNQALDEGRTTTELNA